MLTYLEEKYCRHIFKKCAKTLERVDLCGTLFVHSKRVSGNERVAWFGYSKLAARKAA